MPACGVNSVLSNIPLLGDILASKKGEGILSVTYSATGNMEQPNISTNPLSMLAPGIFRRIFQGHIPNQRDAPTNNESPQAQAQAPAAGAPAIRLTLGAPARAILARPASPERASSCRWTISARRRC